jgi:hypothetical protein
VVTPFQEELRVALAPEGLRGRYLAVYQLSWTAGQTAAPGLFTLCLSWAAALPWIFLLCGLATVMLARLGRMAARES